MVAERVVQILVEQGGSSLLIGVLLFLVWIFYRRQFFQMWRTIEKKDEELSNLNSRVLDAFERNTVAFEKMSQTLEIVSQGIQRVEKKVDKIYGKISK